jgi:hypothetical protein
METVTLEDVRKEIGSSLNSAIEAIDWASKLGLPAEPVAPMAQDTPALPEAFSNLNSWMQNRGEHPLGDDEVLRFKGDQVEVLTASDFARMRQGGAVAGVVSDLDNVTKYDIPFGSVIFGLVPGAVTGEVIDGLLPLRNGDGTLNIANPVAKGAVGVAGAIFADRLVGRRAAGFFVGALALQVFSDAVPLDRFVNWAVRQLRRSNGTAGQTILPARQGDLPLREIGGGNRILQDLAA